MSTKFFRAGVGTVIYNAAGEIAIFKRAQPPLGVWELQQGGIDEGEMPEETLWRELHEEVGLTQDDIETVEKMPDWTVYQRREPVEKSDNILGQAHCWFFLKLKDEVVINLNDALEYAASEFTWTTFDYLIEITGQNKKHVYQELRTYFFDKISTYP